MINYNFSPNLEHYCLTHFPRRITDPSCHHCHSCHPCQAYGPNSPPHLLFDYAPTHWWLSVSFYIQGLEIPFRHGTAASGVCIHVPHTTLPVQQKGYYPPQSKLALVGNWPHIPSFTDKKPPSLPPPNFGAPPHQALLAPPFHFYVHHIGNEPLSPFQSSNMPHFEVGPQPTHLILARTNLWVSICKDRMSRINPRDRPEKIFFFQRPNTYFFFRGHKKTSPVPSSQIFFSF